VILRNEGHASTSIYQSTQSAMQSKSLLATSAIPSFAEHSFNVATVDARFIFFRRSLEEPVTDLRFSLSRFSLRSRFSGRIMASNDLITSSAPDDVRRECLPLGLRGASSISLLEVLVGVAVPDELPELVAVGTLALAAAAAAFDRGDSSVAKIEVFFFSKHVRQARAREVAGAKQATTTRNNNNTHTLNCQQPPLVEWRSQ
jgi:hypothetical protein